MCNVKNYIENTREETKLFLKWLLLFIGCYLFFLYIDSEIVQWLNKKETEKPLLYAITLLFTAIVVVFSPIIFIGSVCFLLFKTATKFKIIEQFSANISAKENFLRGLGFIFVVCAGLCIFNLIF